jgi:hypothetical protein
MDGIRASAPAALDPLLREHIERLFQQSESDPRKTLELKDELDHGGLWAEYQERFMELVSGDPWY